MNASTPEATRKASKAATVAGPYDYTSLVVEESDAPHRAASRGNPADNPMIRHVQSSWDALQAGRKSGRTFVIPKTHVAQVKNLVRYAARYLSSQGVNAPRGVGVAFGKDVSKSGGNVEITFTAKAAKRNKPKPTSTDGATA